MRGVRNPSCLSAFVSANSSPNPRVKSAPVVGRRGPLSRRLPAGPSPVQFTTSDQIEWPRPGHGSRFLVNRWGLVKLEKTELFRVTRAAAVRAADPWTARLPDGGPWYVETEAHARFDPTRF